MKPCSGPKAVRDGLYSESVSGHGLGTWDQVVPNDMATVEVVTRTFYSHRTSYQSTRLGNILLGTSVNTLRKCTGWDMRELVKPSKKSCYLMMFF